MAKRTRINSKVMQLPEEVREELNAKLRDSAISYQEIAEELTRQGYEISKSAIGRYAVRLNEATQRIADTLEKTKTIVKMIEDNPELDYTKASRMLMMDGLLNKVITSEEEFNEMPLDKAGRLIASLSRAETQEKKANRQYQTKMQIALAGLQTEILAKIKGNKELSKEVSALFKKVEDSLNED